MQFGPAGPGFFAISSALVSSKSFDTIKVAATEFNSGIFVAGFEEFDGSTIEAFLVKIYKDDGAGGLMELKNGFNDLVMESLNVDRESARGDPRFFRYPDGTAGVLIERTGVFYKLEEILV
mmetsp:Transcript_11071/g.18472  ORF Transcript_11071/g.18472 Transcript_11071/m.18472 type:complete len:121 (-) Transcript_11071:127-489(-)